MAEEAMLDVSLIVDPQSLQELMKFAYKEKRALSNLRVSRTFVDRLLHENPDDGDIARQISRYFGVSPEDVVLARVRELLRSSAFQNQVEPYRSEGTDRSQDLRARLREGIPEEDAWAAEIMLEEWEFLITHSWLLAKTREIYDRVVDAGANAIYVTKERLEQAIAAVREGAESAGHSILRGSDRLVRKTLKKEPEHKVSPNDRVRTLAKWVAVGGGAAAGIINPVVGAIGAGTGGMFLLYDP
jgi:hypothetical protein